MRAARCSAAGLLLRPRPVAGQLLSLAARASSSSPSPSPPTPRPFRVLGVQQVAIGGTSKAALARLWVDILGLPRVGTYRAERENVDEDILVAGPRGGPGGVRGLGGVEIDLMEPIDAAKAPKVHDPALNHVGLWVDDLHGAVAWMTAAGVRFAPGGIRRGAAGHNVTFIHPKGNDASPIGGAGVLIELVQAPKEVIAAFDEAEKRQ
jgi:lactoylglutathione lyase